MKKRKEDENLLTLRPDIAMQWDYRKNRPLRPEHFSVGSNTKKVWWKCSKGHEFEGRINDRVNKGHGCPVCSNRLIIPGINDLKTLRPDLAAEWDYWQNEIDPTEVGTGSNKRVWWICCRGHRWQTSINDRKKTNCPICARKLRQKKKINVDGVMI